MGIRKYMVTFIVIILILSACVPDVIEEGESGNAEPMINEGEVAEVETESFIYESTDYGFKLEIPKELHNANTFEIVVNEEKYPEAVTTEFTVGEVSEEGIWYGGVLFEVAIGRIEDIADENMMLHETNNEFYYFITADSNTESSSFNGLVNKYRNQVDEVRQSFVVIEE